MADLVILGVPESHNYFKYCKCKNKHAKNNAYDNEKYLADISSLAVLAGSILFIKLAVRVSIYIERSPSGRSCVCCYNCSLAYRDILECTDIAVLTV